MLMNGNSTGNRMDTHSNDASNESPNCDALLNLTILDPAKYGWSVLGGIRNVCPPHENARRESTRLDYLAKKATQKNIKVLPTPTKQNQPTIEIAASNEDKVQPTKAPGESDVVKNDEVEDIQRNTQGNEISINKTQSTTASVTTASSSINSKYDFGSQYSVDIQVIHKPKSKRKPSKKISVEIIPFVQKQSTTDHPENSTVPESQQSTTWIQSKESIETTTTQTESSSSNTEEQNESLHPRAYHRGIEGEEPRNKTTGQLYNDVGITDTNYAWDVLPKDCIIPIRIQFPLSEPDEDYDIEQENSLTSVKQRRHEIRCKSPMLKTESQLRAKRESKEANLVTFQDTIQWDLSNPNTPTPIVYATNIGVEFGLPSLRILDLARSIQNQIDDFIRDYVIYHVPISAKDPYEEKRTKNGLQPVKYKHETKMHGGHCATNVATQYKLFDEVERHTHALEDSNQETNLAPDIQKPNRKKWEDKVIRPEKYDYDVIPIDKIPKHDFNSLGNDIDPVYVEEFLRRSKEEVVKIIRILSNGVIGKATDCNDRKCHWCRKSRKYCIQFACGIESHVLCDFHTSTRFGWRVKDAVDKKLNYCPICAMECTCHICFTKVKELASTFIKECKNQNLGPKDVSFDFILHCSRALSRLAKKKGALKSIGTSQGTKHAKDTKKKTTAPRILQINEQVPKIARDEFPNELSGNINLDPSLKDDYNTIFTPHGSTVIERENETVKVPPPKVHVGDENIDYCIICNQSGDVICCDKCPRSFHAECLSDINVDKLPDEWVCPRCTDDLSEQDEDIKFGYTVIDKLTKVYEIHKNEIGFVDNITILGQLFEICEGLIKADFGPTFEEPVDLKMVPSYKKFVKRPMDLGTIMRNIVEGVYAKYSSAHHLDMNGAETALQMDLIILHVLRDMEQIWYNCFIFNRPGSSFYRMGAVMKIRCSVMKRINIDSKLSNFVQLNYQSFVQNSEADLQNSLSHIIEKDWIPLSKHTIYNTAGNKGFNGNKKKKPVGIYDPDTKMVVKQYSSINIALSVHDFLVSLNHISGLKSSNHTLLRQCINASPDDPSIKLFGYRWMLMENIRSGSFRIDGDVATKGDEVNFSNDVLIANSEKIDSNTNMKNENHSKDTNEMSVCVANDDNDAENDKINGKVCERSEFVSMDQSVSVQTDQKEKKYCGENHKDETTSSNSYFNREPLSSTQQTIVEIPTKKRSLEEMNGSQTLICSPIKLARAKIGSLYENVRYSPRVQKNALSAAKEIICNQVITNAHTRIIAIDISSVAIVEEYDNVASAARNISQEELFNAIQKRILIDNILYICASEKDEIINAMRKAVQPLDDN
jgi:hypothetical protein